MAGPILVTGAAGFVGGHLLEHLLADGSSIVGWYRPGTDASALRAGAHWRPVELLDPGAVGRAVADVGPSAVYHLAGAAHIGQSWQMTLETYQSNVLATHHLLRAVQTFASGVRVLITCSGTIYRALDRPLRESDPLSPASPYATSKLAQEMLALRAWQDDGIPVLVARAFNHTGPGQDPSFVAPGIARQIAQIEAGRQEPMLRVGNLEPRRDLTDVRDVARAYTAMMAQAVPGQPYNVCSGRQLSIRALVEAFVSRARTTITLVQDPALCRPNDAPLLVGDHTRLTRDTGWTPRIPIEQTVDELLAYWRTKVGA
ncbi:MAG TPA: GDP-mannose 4,6-dehydratase [Vicinamibacterales bacterium]|nr:GDP-mannose 4,6-dehydratase [Vicinamibacterales bacterium]